MKLCKNYNEYVVNIVNALEHQAISIPDLAKMINLDRTLIYRIINKQRNLSNKTWIKIANVLKLDIDTGESKSKDINEILNKYDSIAITEAYKQLPFHKEQA